MFLPEDLNEPQSLNAYQYQAEAVDPQCAKASVT